MQELEFEGKKYLSSKRAAEITKYSKDYVGQLARSGKVVAKLVGRNWYIEEGSLLAHAGLEASPHKTPSRMPHEGVSQAIEAPEADSIRVKEESIEANIESGQVETSPHFAPEKSQAPNASSDIHTTESDRRGTWSQPRYLSDSNELLPTLKFSTQSNTEQTESLRDSMEAIGFREHDAPGPRRGPEEHIRLTLQRAESRTPALRTLRFPSNKPGEHQKKSSLHSGRARPGYTLPVLVAVGVFVLVLGWWATSANNKKIAPIKEGVTYPEGSGARAGAIHYDRNTSRRDTPSLRYILNYSRHELSR